VEGRFSTPPPGLAYKKANNNKEIIYLQTINIDSNKRFIIKNVCKIYLE